MITELAKDLIRIASVTPDDAGCIPLICEQLEPVGFSSKILSFENVNNVWLQHGSGDPVFCFLGHTDVVPPGQADKWQSPPFNPEIRDGYLYGRGAADMKGSIAAMISALSRFVSDNPGHEGTVAMILTSDEEGEAVNGTARVVNYLVDQGIQIKWCVVGEPTSEKEQGDTIKVGRRGSLTGHLIIHGLQGHVAYPDKAANPIHLVVPALKELCEIVWDAEQNHKNPTSLQISNINSGTGADNVIPGEVNVQFNVRYASELNENFIKNEIVRILDKYNFQYDLKWLPSSKPYLTQTGDLIKIASNAIKENTGVTPELSTSGGTSDGRFIAPICAEVVEIGPVNASIHKVNECVSVKDLGILADIYYNIMSGLISGNS
jgi:succinyl-diaminopimelate desuccinylase